MSILESYSKSPNTENLVLGTMVLVPHSAAMLATSGTPAYPSTRGVDNIHGFAQQILPADKRALPTITSTSVDMPLQTQPSEPSRLPGREPHVRIVGVGDHGLCM